jgi:hypothetical protein
VLIRHLLAEGSSSGTSILSYLSYVALVGAAFFVLFGVRAGQSRKDLNDSVVALQGRLTADQDEIRGLKETNARQEDLIVSMTQQVSDLRASVRTLERVTTSREIIVAGFTALGVDAKLLTSTSSGEPR